jgi:hypothetical protein
MKIAHKDVKTCITSWKDILTSEFPDQIDVIYAKGSACKHWESEIDYVPLISDVDIHVRFSNPEQDDPLSLLSMKNAINITEKYEKLFKSRRKEFLHLPRVQIVNVNRIIQDPSYISPQVEDIVLLYGWYESPNLLPADVIREFDRSRALSDLTDYLRILPEKTFDRSNLDYWIQLRSMTWRVSPTPVRLLTQLLDISPYKVWTWNRSTIVKELINQDLASLAISYQNFYLSGWKLFLSGFSETEYYRKILNHGHSVLFSTLRIIEKL